MSAPQRTRAGTYSTLLKARGAGSEAENEMQEMTPGEANHLAEAVRAACLKAALEAYERAGMDGLCGEGALEVALDAVRGLDVRRLVEELGRQPGAG